MLWPPKRLTHQGLGCCGGCFLMWFGVFWEGCGCVFDVGLLFGWSGVVFLVCVFLMVFVGCCGL